MWFKINNQRVLINIVAKPNAKRTALLTINDQGLHIALHAMPSDGKANKELINYLSKLFRLPKSQIILQRGELSRFKQVSLPLTKTVQHFIDNPTIT